MRMPLYCKTTFVQLPRVTFHSGFRHFTDITGGRKKNDETNFSQWALKCLWKTINWALEETTLALFGIRFHASKSRTLEPLNVPQMKNDSWEKTVTNIGASLRYFFYRIPIAGPIKRMCESPTAGGSWMHLNAPGLSPELQVNQAGNERPSWKGHSTLDSGSSVLLLVVLGFFFSSSGRLNSPSLL